MLPFQLLIVSLFVEIVNLGLVDHYLGAVLPLAAHPIDLFFMRQHMLGISDDLLAAGRVDGANEYRIFWSVVLPNIRPALATLFILFALEYWNNLLWPLIVFRQAENMPLAVGLASMVNQYKVAYDLLLGGLGARDPARHRAVLRLQAPVHGRDERHRDRDPVT